MLIICLNNLALYETVHQVHLLINNFYYLSIVIWMILFVGTYMYIISEKTPIITHQLLAYCDINDLISGYLISVKTSYMLFEVFKNDMT